MESFFRKFATCLCRVLLGACAAQAHAEAETYYAPAPDNHWSYDEVTAYVPREQAETPSVALAKINIAFYQAKQLTEARLCAGKWTPRGMLQYQQGPEVTRIGSNESKGPHSAWFFQSFRRPETLVCPDVTRAEYFMEMSRHLPAWISVCPARQPTTFRLGQAFTGDRHALAVR